MLHAPAPAKTEGNALSKWLMSGCPCCGGTSTEVIYRVPSIPVHSCVLLETPAAALNFPRRDLELSYCNECGFAYNRIFDEAAMRYSTDFEESQHFSDTFNGFASRLAAEIADRCQTSGKRILEIGCGKGEFLTELCRVGGARGVGIDPGYREDAGRLNRSARVEFVVDHFGPDYAGPIPDVVLCRHTLEHIPAVASFVAYIRRTLGDRRDAWVVFETPDFKRVLKEAAFWDIYYEHCSYFSPGTHAHLFRANEFDVTDLALAYDAQYIIQYARPAHGRTRAYLPLEHDCDELRALARTFSERARRNQARWRKRIGEAHQHGRAVMLWGGGSKAVSFLTTLDLRNEIRAVVDINPYKQGKFVAGTAHPVVPPESIAELHPDLVIVMNPIYVEEVRRALASLNLHPEVVAV
jgi:2-polyprenyl-3-methyl-5-hydroxy-6-metoxy-1,4-benzoquinol methylase